MAIVGFNLEKILVERKKDIKGKIEIKSKADITDIKKEPLRLREGTETLRFNFSFSIKYEPAFAEVDFKGFILVLEEPKAVKSILKDWKKKKIDPALHARLFNIILKKCNIKALTLEEDLNLPPHIPLMRVRKEAPSYT